MARIISIDYGKKRIGLAVTDPLQIIASPMETVATSEIFDFLENYFNKEDVEAMVVGEPMHADGQPTYLEEDIQKFIKKVEEKYPNLIIHRQDERYTSWEAKEAILKSGVRKKREEIKHWLIK